MPRDNLPPHPAEQDSAPKPVNARETYRALARYYDLYVGAFDSDLALYRSICGAARNVIEVGCGTGRVLSSLLEAGIRVMGIDVSDEMLDVARSKLSGYLETGALRLRNHDLRRAPLGDECDCLLVTFYTFNYLLTDSDQHQFLANAQRSISPNGILAMDLFFPESLARPDSAGQWQESALKSGARRVNLRQKKVMIGPIEERIQVFTEQSRREEVVTRRCYVNKQRLVTLLKDAGFADFRATERYDESAVHPLSPGEATDSPYVCLASRPG